MEPEAQSSAAVADADTFVVPDGFEDVSGSGGVFKKVLKEGEGSARPGDEDSVFVHYTGTLYGGQRDGEKFDSSLDRNEPFSFKLGTGQVIKAWDIAVATMRLGEECEILLKPEFGYGSGGSGSIPPNAALKFSIRLLRWEGEDVTEAKDKGVVKHRTRKGEGYTQPKEGAQVTAKLTGRIGDRQFESRTVSFELGAGEDCGVPQGVELGLKAMSKGEAARLSLQPAYAFGEAGSEQLGVPPNSAVDYEVELVDFEKIKESWELSEEEKVAQSELLKTKGTEYFKRGKLKQALSFYNRVVEHLKWDSGFEDKPEELRNQRRQLLLAARLNLSLVQHKLGSHHECIAEAGEALQLDANSAKAFFRRGLARMALRDYEEARADFDQVARIEPGNKAALSQAQLAKQRIQEERARQKKTFYGMFDKFAKADAKKSGGDQQQQQQNGGSSKPEAAPEPMAAE